MTLEIERYDLTPMRTIGHLRLDNAVFCYTLEDCVRDMKIPHETAIPVGTYAVILNDSVRFKRRMPLLQNVPGFEGVRIHPGNTTEDTSGCILVGFNRQENTITGSRRAFESLMARMEAAVTANEPITAIVYQGVPVALEVL